MAYLDGELSVDRAALVAEHLEQCAECRAWVEESRALSERLTAWQVEPAPPSLVEHVTAAVPAGELKPQATATAVFSPPQTRQFGLPRWLWATAGVVCMLVLIAAVSIPNLLRSRIAANQSASLVRAPGGGGGGAYAPTAQVTDYLRGLPASAGPLASMTANASRRDLYKKWLAQDASAIVSAGAREAGSPIAAPMIVRTASLKLLTKDFDKTRAAIEEVVQRRRGYSAQLAAGSESNGARTFSANFRVPADQLDAAITEIKQLAHVEQESQGGEEVTEQYVDLTARLSNARRTEQQLLDVLEKRTGRLSDVLEVERELARVREEIERMEGELKSLQNRVSFATLRVEVREEYKAELEMTPPSIGGRLRNAVVEGYRTAVDSVVGLVMFLLSVGPFLLLWALILFWPARYVWRRLRAASEPK